MMETNELAAMLNGYFDCNGHLHENGLKNRADNIGEYMIYQPNPWID